MRLPGRCQRLSDSCRSEQCPIQYDYELTENKILLTTPFSLFQNSLYTFESVKNTLYNKSECCKNQNLIINKVPLYNIVFFDWKTEELGLYLTYPYGILFKLRDKDGSGGVLKVWSSFFCVSLESVF